MEHKVTLFSGSPLGPLMSTKAFVVSNSEESSSTGIFMVLWGGIFVYFRRVD